MPPLDTVITEVLRDGPTPLPEEAADYQLLKGRGGQIQNVADPSETAWDDNSYPLSFGS